ncbi:MAG TPA: TonB-dependent receptor [Clostridia bacterium]|nr:TonB-dependent receptor [Clostridia bacterium]
MNTSPSRPTTFWSQLGVMAVLFALLVTFSAPGAAQERFGSIAGVATDPSGAVVSDVAVTVTNKSTGRTTTARTRNDGTYSAPDLEPGRYTVRFEKQGFSKQEVGDAAVLLGRTTNVSAAMRVGAVDQTVEVTGEVPAVDTTTTMIATNVTSEEIERLPKGRNFQEMAVLAPSVNTGTIEGGFQINGASAAENNYYIDGVSTNSVIDGSARQNATFDYLQEVQVKTTGLDAEYGGALGGVVSAVTKSGGNQFHGEGHYYYYGNRLNAIQPKRLAINDPSTPAGTPLPTVVGYIQDDEDRNDTHEFGGSLGGPIIKDRLWFYTSASPRWQSRQTPYVFSSPDDPTGATGVPFHLNRNLNQWNWFSKISFDPTSRIRTNFTYLYTPTYMTGSLPAYTEFRKNGGADLIEDALARSSRGFMQPESSITGQVDFTLTNTTLVSVKGGRYYLNYKDKGVPYQWFTQWNVDATNFPGIPSDLQREALAQTPNAAQTIFDITTRTYVQADVSQSARFFGAHNFKVGVGTMKNVNNVDDRTLGPLGRVLLNFGTGFTLAGNDRGDLGFYSVDDLRTQGSTGANITHVYVQDAWQLFRRLTLNAGVRFEKEAIPSFRPDIQKYAFEFGYGDKVSPRLGFALDVLGNGRLKLSGGWGRYFDWTKFDVARGTFGADTWHVFYRSLDSANFQLPGGGLDSAAILAINLNNMPGRNLWAGEFRDRRVPGFDTLDPNVKPMSAETWHAGIEYELAKNLVVSTRFVRNYLNRTIEDMGALDEQGNEVYRYGNPGEGANAIAPSAHTCLLDLPAGACGFPMPKARRVYSAAEFQVSKRFGGGWLANASYVYSQLWGNYSGTQSTDEIRPSTLGAVFGGNQVFAGQIFRPGGNANRYFDLDETMWDANGRLGLYGRLPTDRPHVFKFSGAKSFGWGTDVGGFFRVQSGTPVTTQLVTANSIPMYVEGRGDLGRTPVFSQTDLVVGHNFKTGEGKALRVEFNMINLFNQKTETYTFDRFNREDREESAAPHITGADSLGINFAQGFDWRSTIATTSDFNVVDPVSGLPTGVNYAIDPRYGMAAEFQRGFEGRVAIKYTF